VGKLYIFSAAMEANYVGLALLAVLCSVIAVFFYLRVVLVMYMEEPREEMPSPTLSPGILFTGILPGTMWEVAVRVVERFLG
jgi:NADH-quinone oxidoreductase subunit N